MSERTILEMAEDAACWQEFLEYKLERQHLDAGEEREIRDFLEREAYIPLCRQWRQGVFPMGYPVRKSVNKHGSRKKRIVYSFPGDDGILLKFVAFQLYRYDGRFCDNCYAFRRGLGVREATLRIRRTPRLWEQYCLKVDISDYFNSIRVETLMEKLEFVREDDPALYGLFARILLREQVESAHVLVPDRHGAMAGVPLSPFLANIYLSEADWRFAEQGILYFRYSDDILIFAPDEAELSARRDRLYEMFGELGLSVNPDKVHVSKPGEPWEFLGFSYDHGQLDLSEVTVKKMEAKIRRKARALRRWQRKKGLAAEKAAIGLIHAMNWKFYGKARPDDGGADADTDEEEMKDFTWSRWFFPNLTTDRGLRRIDACMQEYIRYAVTGRHYKGNYRIRYEQLKAWGYRSLVHEFYQYRKEGPVA